MTRLCQEHLRCHIYEGVYAIYCVSTAEWFSALLSCSRKSCKERYMLNYHAASRRAQRFVNFIVLLPKARIPVLGLCCLVTAKVLLLA